MLILKMCNKIYWKVKLGLQDSLKAYRMAGCKMDRKRKSDAIGLYILKKKKSFHMQSHAVQKKGKYKKCM